jgi:hypothetical protein
MLWLELRELNLAEHWDNMQPDDGGKTFVCPWFGPHLERPFKPLL